jgi:hypothetical protein
VLLTPVDPSLQVKDIRLSYRLTEAAFNKTPVAVIQGAEIARRGESVKLNAGLSSDADGIALHYQWKIKSGKARIISSSTDEEVLILPRRPGKLVVELQVNDGTANSQAIEKTIVVKGRRLNSLRDLLSRLFAFNR